MSLCCVNLCRVWPGYPKVVFQNGYWFHSCKHKERFLDVVLCIMLGNYCCVFSTKCPCKFHDISFYTLSAIRVFWSFQSLILTHNILIALVNDNSAYFHWFHRVSWTPWKLLWTPKKLPVEFPHKFLILTLFLWLHENSFFPPWSFHGALVWSCEFFNFKGRI